MINMVRGRRWIKEKKKAFKKKLKEATKGEKMEMVKAQLDLVYQSYTGLLEIRPEIKKRIEELEGDEDNEELKNMWSKVLKEINNLEKRPKVMKPRYVKGILKNIKKLREKYPNE